MRKLILLIMTLIFTAKTWAATSGVNESATTAVSNGTATTSPSTPQATAPPSTTKPAAGINDSAKSGGISQYAGSMVSGVVGAGLLVYASQCTDCKSWAYPMAAMALLQAATSLLSAQQSGNTADNSGNWNDNTKYPTGDPGGGVNDPGSITGNGGNDTAPPGVDQLKKQIDSGLNLLKDKGIFVDTGKGTITTPEGTKPLSSFSNPAAMAAAGFSPSQISAASALVDRLSKEGAAKYGSPANVVAVGVESGGEGGGSGSFASTEDNGMAAYLRRLGRPLTDAQKAKLIAGKSILAGGEPIGVKGDDIFQMISRHYALKRRGNEFIEMSEVKNVPPKNQPVGFTPQRKR